MVRIDRLVKPIFYCKTFTAQVFQCAVAEMAYDLYAKWQGFIGSPGVCLNGRKECRPDRCGTTSLGQCRAGRSMSSAHFAKSARIGPSWKRHSLLLGTVQKSVLRQCVGISIVKTTPHVQNTVPLCRFEIDFADRPAPSAYVRLKTGCAV